MESTFTRRELLKKSSVVLLLVPVVPTLAGCGAGSGGTACDGVFSTSSVTDNHTHTLCVPSVDLTSPPASGATYTTSTSVDHTHTVALTADQLQTINTGGQVQVTSSAPAAHDFTIKKA